MADEETTPAAQAPPPPPPPQPMNLAQQRWAEQEEGELAADRQAAESDAEYQLSKSHPIFVPGPPGGLTLPGRWNPFRRILVNRRIGKANIDRMEENFEGEVSSEIASGQIEVPAGGPVTPEEEFTVLEHPWPGHSEREAVERLREARAKGEPWPPPPDAPAGQ